MQNEQKDAQTAQDEMIKQLKGLRKHPKQEAKWPKRHWNEIQNAIQQSKTNREAFHK